MIDAFRVESLDESEQAAGMASYVAAYRIGMLVSTAGALFLVSGFEGLGLGRHAAWSAGYAVMAVLVLIGMATTLIATEPDKSAQANAAHAGEKPLKRVIEAAVGAFSDFLARDLALVALAFVILFKFTDALAGAMTAPFVIDLGFSRNEYAAIIKGVGLAATLIGGFAGGFLARAYPLAASLWIGGLLQAAANLAFSWQAVVGYDVAWLTFAIVMENFTSAIGTVIFVAYLSALCQNPLHTATQYALLTALAAFGRTYLSSGAGYHRGRDRLGLVLRDLRAGRPAEPRRCSGGCRRAGISTGSRRRRPSAALARRLRASAVAGVDPSGSGSRPCCGNTCHLSRLSHSNGSPSHLSLLQTLSRRKCQPVHFISWIVPQSPVARALWVELSVRVLASKPATCTL